MEELQNKTWMRRSAHIHQYLRGWIIASVIVFVVLGVVIGVVTIFKQRAIGDLNTYKYELDQDVAELDALLHQKKILEQDQQKLSLRLDKITFIGNDTYKNPYKYLQSLASIIPDGVVLKMFSFDKKIRLEGFADNVQQITRFMRLLAKSKEFKTPQLVSMNRRKKGSSELTDSFDELGGGKVWFVMDMLKA